MLLGIPFQWGCLHVLSHLGSWPHEPCYQDVHWVDCSLSDAFCGDNRHVQHHSCGWNGQTHVEGILPKGPYLPCVGMWWVGPFWQDTPDLSLHKAQFKGIHVKLWYARFPGGINGHFHNPRWHPRWSLIILENAEIPAIINFSTRAYCYTSFCTQSEIKIHFSQFVPREN